MRWSAIPLTLSSWEGLRMGSSPDGRGQNPGIAMGVPIPKDDRAADRAFTADNVGVEIGIT